jgi:DNA polymerase III subunit gamma/tau
MYRALYRKWRPQRFEDVVGQRAIVTALKNQITAGRVGHAYLFTGVRGTGKTTCAKIFAKAVNCLHPVNGDPCGECEICKGIDNGSLLDVVEMDAASNNGVDDIRDLRDETAYTPSACQYKVYIIDEVHMLSTAAFNALLKTLEEPPAHVIFILATTEIQKVPATILSRCQRYDFTRIGPEDIARRVEYIAGEEKLELTSDGAELIARLADGALRDALSILDTCAGVTAKIDADVVRRMAGVTDRSYLFQISDALEAQDAAAALAQLAQLRQQSVDVKRLTEELIAHYRALMLAALPGGQALLSGVSPEEEALYLQKGPEMGQREAIRAIRTLGTALEHMTRGSDQRIELERHAGAHEEQKQDRGAEVVELLEELVVVRDVNIHRAHGHAAEQGRDVEHGADPAEGEEQGDGDDEPVILRAPAHKKGEYEAEGAAQDEHAEVEGYGPEHSARPALPFSCDGEGERYGGAVFDEAHHVVERHGLEQGVHEVALRPSLAYGHERRGRGSSRREGREHDGKHQFHAQYEAADEEDQQRGHAGLADGDDDDLEPVFPQRCQAEELARAEGDEGEGDVGEEVHALDDVPRYEP